METDTSDAALIARSLGEPDAFRHVFDRHFDPILRYCRRRLGSDGEDIASDVFVVAFERRGRYESSAPNARPWLYGIASNLLRTKWRSERRRLRATARLIPEADSSPDLDSSERLDAIRARPQIAAALAALKPDDRDTLLLHIWGGLGYEEVAAALSIPVGTVRSRIHRARTQVRAHLAPDERSPIVVEDTPCPTSN